MKKAKAAALTGVVLLFLFAFAVLVLALPDQSVSRAERRKLAQRPAFSSDGFFSGSFAKDLERWYLDQFPGRDRWRALQARLRFDVFRQQDSNGVYIEDGSVSRLEYPLDEKQVNYAANQINSTIETFLQGSEVRFAVIPDKNYFLAGDRPHIDYERMFEILDGTVAAERIDLTPCLRPEFYYTTDSHWRQEYLGPVAKTIADSFGVRSGNTPANSKQEVLYPFYGVYYGQSALDIVPDPLVYLRSDVTDAAVMTGPELKGEQPVYTLERFEGMDGYDIFCAGPQSVLTIESPLVDGDRELIVFRDSFGSSLAPLLLEQGYRTITLIDLRYISSRLLDQFVDFHGQDVLFLYSTSLLNSGMLLK